MTDGLGLGDAYGATLDRIKGQDGAKARLGMAALMWISHAERPLKPEELCHALAVEIGSPNVNSDNVPSIGTLLSCCQGLFVVDKKAPTVRLIHFTLQEYLRAHPKLFSTTHSMMAETCLSYLNSHQVKALSTMPSPDLHDAPFLEYSSVYWGAHAKRDLSNCAKSLALRLFGDCNNQIPIKLLLEGQEYYSHIRIDSAKLALFGGLHYASLFGIVEIVVGLAEMEGCDINQEDCIGNTPLTWAACNGHEGVVEVLLGRDDINPNKQGVGGQTPLHCAAFNGHEEVVKVLLEQDEVNPDKPDNDGQTPLWCAAFNGHARVVKVLLEQDEVNPDRLDNDGRTPLWIAVCNGHVRVVEMLLERDEVNPDEPHTNGRTPLHCAAFNGHAGVVEALLEQDEVNPDKPDNDGRTPLWCAAFNGRVGVVKVLLERDEVNPDRPSSDGQTPLHCAALNGHEEVAKVLPEQNEVNPDKPDNNGHHHPVCRLEWTRGRGENATRTGRRQPQ